METFIETMCNFMKTMVRSFTTEDENREYVGIEEGLQLANRLYISVNQNEMDKKRSIVETIVAYLIDLMREESQTFHYLYVETFGGGSGYEGLKITKPDEFDIDILMQIPRFFRPVLLENNIPGYVNLKLENLHQLQRRFPEMYSEVESLVDENNYLLTDALKGSFMQSIFDRVLESVPANAIFVNNRRFVITRVQNLGPAFTLTIQGPEKFKVSVDLVPCIRLGKYHWPGAGFESNPYSTPSDFFIVPKSPKRDIPHIKRYWRLSFQKQEREIMFDKERLKPTIRVLKRIRDKFDHKVSSYAIKTMFLRKLRYDNPDFLDDEIPELWLSPLSYCVVYMLEVYSKCLGNGEISYFWNKKMNLIEDLTRDKTIRYKNDIDRMLQDIKFNTDPETILKYLR